MSTTTAIEWTEMTWNPTTGCDKVSPGCENCYACPMAKRLKAMGSPKYQTDGDPRTSGPGFGVAMHPDVLAEPLRWRQPRMVFVNSMSDLFHGKVSVDFIAQVFAVMSAGHHTYQVLTKRSLRMRRLLQSQGFRDKVEAARNIPGRWSIPGTMPWPLPNVWLGVSVENQQWADIRIPMLLDTPTAIRFLSCEPLLGPLDLKPYLGCWRRDEAGRVLGSAIDWVIAGGESGTRARPVDANWIRSLRDDCRGTPGTAFLFKQWGGRTPKAGGRELDGRTWDEYPERAA